MKRLFIDFGLAFSIFILCVINARAADSVGYALKGDTVAFSWKANPDTETTPLTGYKLYTQLPNGTPVFLKDIAKTATTTSVEFPGVTTSYMLTAYNLKGESGFSDKVKLLDPAIQPVPGEFTITITVKASTN